MGLLHHSEITDPIPQHNKEMVVRYKYVMFIDHTNGSNYVQQGDDLIELIQRANVWLKCGVWASAHIVQVNHSH